MILKLSDDLHERLKNYCDSYNAPKKDLKMTKTRYIRELLERSLSKTEERFIQK